MQYGKAEDKDPLMKQCGRIPGDSYSEQNRSPEVTDLRLLFPFSSLHRQDGERWGEGPFKTSFGY